MALDQTIILKQIDDVLTRVKEIASKSKWDDLSDLQDNLGSEAATLLSSTIQRLAPPGSSYLTNIKSTHNYGGPQGLRQSVNPLVGILIALRFAYANGYLDNVQELIHADVFSDFIEMADHLLENGYKDPAAVIVGSVLEEHLRKLCAKNGIGLIKGDGSPKKADTLNSELAAKPAYSKLDQKSITAWLDLRNKAAHGQYTGYTSDQVSLMLAGVRDFIARLPA